MTIEEEENSFFGGGGFPLFSSAIRNLERKSAAPKRKFNLINYQREDERKSENKSKLNEESIPSEQP